MSAHPTGQVAGGPVGLSAGTPADEQRRRGLRRMRAVAVGLLFAAAVVYVLTLDRPGAWAYVHAGSEAAMVGAIADWFAVTALFRHPLGLPIPHTAIIPTRKGALARSLQEFVTDNFLAESVVRDRVRTAQVSLRIGHWLVEPAHCARVVEEGSALAHTALEKVRDEDVRTLLETEVIPRLVEEPLSEIAGRLLGDIVDEGAHHGLVDLVLAEAHRWLLANPAAFSVVLTTRAPWWTPQWLDERVIGRIYTELMEWVIDIRDDPHHQARQALDDLLRQLAQDLRSNPDTMERAERLKARLLCQPQVLVTAMSLWRSLRLVLQESLDSPDSTIRSRATVALGTLGQQLIDDDELRGRYDELVSDGVAFLVGRYGDELTTVITDTIDRWDGREAARRIELHVGRDLQFIRINGTVVGGLAGLVIYALTQAL